MLLTYRCLVLLYIISNCSLKSQKMICNFSWAKNGPRRPYQDTKQPIKLPRGKRLVFPPMIMCCALIGCLPSRWLSDKAEYVKQEEMENLTRPLLKKRGILRDVSKIKNSQKMPL